MLNLLNRVSSTTRPAVRRRNFSSPPSLEDPISISNHILRSDQLTLPETIQWSPDLVHAVLKRLWNHGPKALQFFSLLDRHQTYTHSATAFDHAIDICARLRDFKTLWSLVDRVRARGLGPGPKTFAIIIERYVSFGEIDRALKIFLSMHKHGCPQNLNSFNALLDVLCKSKRPEMAYRVLKTFRGRFRADVISYNTIANGYCLIKQTPKALGVLKEMVERGLEPNLITYNTMLKGFFRAGQTKEAWEFFLQMKRRKCEIDVVTYTTLVHGFGVAGEVEKARKLFTEMVGAGALPSVATYNALIQVLCKNKSVDDAILVFEEMKKKGYVPNTMSYNLIIRALCHVGRFDQAMEYMDKMKENECEPNIQTCNVVIRYYCDAGDVEKALEVFDSMSSGSCLPNLDTYNILIRAMFVRKKPEDLVVAGKLLLEMVHRGYLPRRFTFNRVLNGLQLTGNQSFAKEILAELSISGHLPRHFRL